MCSSMRAHWRDLANMTELVLHSVHLTPQPRGQIDRFRVSIHYNDRFSPKIAPSHGDLDPIQHDSLAHPSPQTKRHLHRFSCFCTDDRRVSLHFTTERPLPSQNCPFPSGDLDPHLTWFRGPTRVLKQKASRSVQPFLQGSLV